ncbi:TetR/AcrR family transcriptional regulator [Elusimicrobiota bacterium]
MNKQQQILAAAREVFAQKGFHGTSIKDIATKASVAQGTPYLYFKSKEELFEKLILSLLDETNSVLKEIADQKKDLLGKLDDFVTENITNAYKHREISIMLMRDSGLFSSAKNKKNNNMMAIFKERENIIEDTFKKHKDDNVIDPDFDCNEAAKIFTAIVAGMSHKIIMGADNDTEKSISMIKKTVRKALIKK